MNFLSVRDKLEQMLNNVSTLIFGVGIAITFFGVIFRYIPFFPSLSWTDELTRFCIILSVFLITGIGIRRGTQMAFTFVLEQLPKAPFTVLTIINALLMLVFQFVMGYYGLKLAVLNKDQLSAVLQIPMIYPYLIIPFGSLLMIFENVMRILDALTRRVEPTNDKQQHAV